LEGTEAICGGQFERRPLGRGVVESVLRGLKPITLGKEFIHECFGFPPPPLLRLAAPREAMAEILRPSSGQKRYEAPYAGTKQGWDSSLMSDQSQFLPPPSSSDNLPLPLPALLSYKTCSCLWKTLRILLRK
jgi:hypothetical protein